jgi:hypothetical protein
MTVPVITEMKIFYAKLFLNSKDSCLKESKPEEELFACCYGRLSILLISCHRSQKLSPLAELCTVFFYVNFSG